MSYSEEFERVRAMLQRMPNAERILLNTADLEEYQEWVRNNNVAVDPALVGEDIGLNQREMVVQYAGWRGHYADGDHCMSVASLWPLKGVTVHTYDNKNNRFEVGAGLVVGYILDCPNWTNTVVVSGPSFALPHGGNNMFVAEVTQRDLRHVSWTVPDNERVTAQRPFLMGVDWWCLDAEAKARVVEPDPGRFPHVCPRCGKPAYIGFSSTECSNQACK